MGKDICVEAVIFDLDGTLVATDRFWPDAARAGALRAWDELGLDAELPGPEVWMAMVGQPLSEAFDAAFPELEPARRRRLEALCVEEEHRLLAEGRAGLLPGVESCLAQLSDRGVRLGIASNCSAAYLDEMMRGLGLARWIEEGRCLNSPGIRDKADMVEDLLLTFETRHAVMVGDRRGDRDAAWANGIPHVHLARGYALASEDVQAEGRIEGMDALMGLLGERASRVRTLLDSLAVPTSGSTVLVTGCPFSGLEELAKDLASEWRLQGRSAALLPSAEWVDWDADLEGAPDPLAGMSALLDLDTIDQALAAPVPGGSCRVLALPLALHPALLRSVDRVIWLEASAEVRWRRAMGELGRFRGAPTLERLLGSLGALEAALRKSLPPSRLAHLVLDATDALRPARALAPPSGAPLS